ncbi:MAG: type IV toxin-antitoxin system AbiEi family antitoxin [Bryobacteraceae bacterium]
MKHTTDHWLESVATLRRIPFVRDIRYLPASAGEDLEHDGKIDIRTPGGRFHLLVETRRSFLTHSDVGQLLAWSHAVRKTHPQQVILFARHVPRPVAERLIEEQVNFADDVGNVHLALGDRFHWTAIGTPAPKPASERRPISAAQVQLLFQLVIHPESVNWTVRRLEAAAGISKSKAAQLKQQMLAEGLLTFKGKDYQLGARSFLAERLTSGYLQVLRPKLVIGRFRFAEKTTESFLARLKGNTPAGVRYALTGGSAAHVLQHVYRAPEVSMFIEPAHRQTAQELRLLPDREGPVTLLDAFGAVVFGEKRDGHVVAPAWLVYAELLASDDPRAHEAAREFREELLS